MTAVFGGKPWGTNWGLRSSTVAVEVSAFDLSCGSLFCGYIPILLPTRIFRGQSAARRCHARKVQLITVSTSASTARPESTVWKASESRAPLAPSPVVCMMCTIIKILAACIASFSNFSFWCWWNTTITLDNRRVQGEKHASSLLGDLHISPVRPKQAYDVPLSSTKVSSSCLDFLVKKYA